MLIIIYSANILQSPDVFRGCTPRSIILTFLSLVYSIQHEAIEEQKGQLANVAFSRGVLRMSDGGNGRPPNRFYFLYMLLITVCPVFVFLILSFH